MSRGGDHDNRWGGYQFGETTLAGEDEAQYARVRITQVDKDTNVMEPEEATGNLAAFKQRASNLLERRTHSKTKVEFWDTAYEVKGRLGVFVNLHMNHWIPCKEWLCPVAEGVRAVQDHAGMYNRVLDMRAVLYALRGARWRTNEKFWTFQLVKIETGNNAMYRAQ